MRIYEKQGLINDDLIKIIPVLTMYKDGKEYKWY
jgi:hypothetical protein